MHKQIKNFRDTLKPEKIGNTLLDMSQYKFLFGTTRIPNNKKDILHFGHPSSKHILVVRNGHVILNFLKNIL